MLGCFSLRKTCSVCSRNINPMHSLVLVLTCMPSSLLSSLQRTSQSSQRPQTAFQKHSMQTHHVALNLFRTRQDTNKTEYVREIFLFIFFSLLGGAAPAAYGGSQARGLIRAVAAGLRLSHSNSRSEPHL